MDKRETQVLKQWQRCLDKRDIASLKKIMHKETSAGYQVFDLSKLPVTPEPASLVSKKMASLKYSRNLFDGKTVTDLGCSLGFFSFYAVSQGATVKGYDFKELYIAMNKAAAQKYTEWFPETKDRISFERQDLSCLPELPVSDVVLSNSVVHWFIMKGVPLTNILDWLKNICSEAVLYEGPVTAKEKVMVDHKVPEEALTMDLMMAEAGARFQKVEVIGTTTYNPERYVLRLWK